MAALPPLTDTILFALAQAADDAQTQPPREPSHSDLDFLVKAAGLTTGDPKASGQLVGKAKRIRIDRKHFRAAKSVVGLSADAKYHRACNARLRRCDRRQLENYAVIVCRKKAYGILDLLR